MEIIEVVSHKELEPLKIGILHDLIREIGGLLFSHDPGSPKKIKRDESWRSSPQGTIVT